MKFSCIFTHFSTLSSKENKEVLTKNNFFVSKEEETAIQTTTPSIALHNQEAIHIPANTTLADGTPIQADLSINKSTNSPLCISSNFFTTLAFPSEE